MNREIHLTPLAHRDIADASLWHEAQQAGLGARFFEQLDAALETVAARPGSFPDVHAGMRRAQLRDFEYGVFFYDLGDRIVVTAVLSMRREPSVWQARRL
jgi:plasmid stabilization system protein ParE